MPYRDKGKQREAVKRAVAKHRGITVIPENPTVGKPNVIPVNPVNEEVLQGYALADVAHLKEFISQGRNLEKLQRVCRELGKNREHVFMGAFRLDDLGKAIL